ncbi:rhodanese-like domain-containing protein [Paenibacillus endoradicis]|uniref:rhodanese-like domain-containing protein n=1 Tax=Paenibacillus endoradicis TaxID=2972487 RepID=UPI002158AE71|nr:rhodanese-like domain-containing protein [Paenibacillus endoradicis]MCR8657163.1 rhodanese-like domain-containing protein [Paenibacillus endoradicis]
MKEITTFTLQKMIEDSESLNVIDVRNIDEIATGYIAESIHIPLPLVEFKLPDIEKSKKYYVICRSGGRSAIAVQFLEDRGYNVTNVQGGMDAWTGPMQYS